MKKTVTANISGFFFHIDEDAYEVLNKYLAAIRSCFSGSESKDEIMSDIEARIAEMFKSRLTPGKEVITLIDVNEVIALMGQPSDYMEGADNTSFASQQEFKTKKRIFRDPDNDVLGGVCGGLGAYFHIDPIWLRLAFVVMLLAFGFGPLIYIVLWIIIPKARTASEKLEMRGEPININNISRTINEEFENVKKNFSNLKEDANNLRKEGPVAGFIGDVTALIISLVNLLVKAVVKIAGVLLIIVAAFICMVIIGILFDDNFILNFNDQGVSVFTFKPFAEVFFNSPKQSTLAYTGVIFLLIVPMLAFLTWGVKMLLGIKNRLRPLKILYTVLFFAGFIMCAVVGVEMSKQFSQQEKHKSNIILPTNAQTLQITSVPHDFKGEELLNSDDENEIILGIQNDSIYFGYPEIDIRRSLTDSFEVEIVKSAHGKTSKIASERASQISYNWFQTDSTVVFPSAYTSANSNKFRNQQLRIIIKVPEGKSVVLSNEVGPLLYDVDNVENMWDGDMVGHTWKMLPAGLTCLDCRMTDTIPPPPGPPNPPTHI